MGLVVQVERFVWQLQKDTAMHHLSPQHLQALLDQHMRSTLNQYEHQRIVSTQPLSTDDVENGSLAWDYLAKDTQDQLARNDYGRVKLSTDVLLEENAIKLDPSSIEYRRVCRELLKTEARLIHIEQQRTQGKYEQPLESEVVTQVQPVTSPTGSGSVFSAMSAGTSTPHNLSTLIQAYVDEHKNTCWTEKTEAEYVAILNLFMSIVGDLPLAVLNAQTILHFRKIVSQLPANMNKLKQFKGKSIEAILALPDVKPMSRSNANKYLIRVSQLLKWAHELDYIHKNFAENKTLPSEKQPDKQRDAFTTDDIKTIFHNEEYSNPTLRGRDREAYQYWLPLMALFSGARIEELCQLQLADVRLQDGVWILDITDEMLEQKIKSEMSKAYPLEDKKKLKTNAAKRIVCRRAFKTDHLCALNFDQG
jgi:integrase